jgi:heterodisulfide reductase subunit B
MGHKKMTVNKDYRKDIAENNYYYVRSCIRQNFFPGSEATFLRILRDELGKDIMDDSEHTTCSGIGYHSDIVPFETIQTIVARQFALMTEKGYKNLAVSCVTSFGIYIEITETWKEFPEELEKIRHYLKKATGRKFEVPENIAHTSDIIHKFRNDIFKKHRYSLVDQFTRKPLKIVEHIGCHYAKMFPEKGEGGAEFSQVLTGMIRAWGGEVVDYPERRHCCGFGFRHYIVQANRGYSLSNTKKKFESMAPFEPDLIIANCPGCAMFMDKWQYVIAETEHKTYDGYGNGIPVLTYEELAGLVLGYNPWDLGMQTHQVDCEPLFQKMGIAYKPEDKFKGLNGKNLGEPVKVESLCSECLI